MPTSMTVAVDRIHVAVGVIKNNRQEILIAKRAMHLHQGGLWEFPGGKVENDETAQQALYRELHEELGIKVEIASPFIEIIHDYPDRSVLLDVWLVEKFSGHPHAHEAQPLRWVSISELKHYPFPQANHDIVRALESRYQKLPDEIMITGPYDSMDDYVVRLRCALSRGVKWVQLRAHCCSYNEYRALYEITDMFCEQHGAQLVVNTSLDWFQHLRAAGLHLTTERLLQSVNRPVHKSILFGASCHNPDEIQHAINIDVDYITLAPVFKTPTHPEQQPIGLDKFASWVKGTNIPVFALGGVNPELKQLIQDAGAYGVAGISNYWRKT